MQIVNYLGFHGTCKEAFTFYEKCLGGQIVAMMGYEDMPSTEEISPEWKGRIVHARLIIGSAVLMGGDAPPSHPLTPAEGFCVSIMADSSEEAERFFAALADGGKIDMPIAETFWAHRFGMLTDKFGIPWMINHEKPMGQAA